MPIERVVSLLLAALAAGAVFVATAAAVVVPPRAPMPPLAVPVPVAVPTAATLPGAGYPWIEPVWVAIDGVSLPQLPMLQLGPRATQPPAWIVTA